MWESTTFRLGMWQNLTSNSEKWDNMISSFKKWDNLTSNSEKWDNLTFSSEKWDNLTFSSQIWDNLTFNVAIWLLEGCLLPSIELLGLAGGLLILLIVDCSGNFISLFLLIFADLKIKPLFRHLVSS